MRNQALDLGCGMRKHPDDPSTKWYGCDIRKFPGVDFVCDIGKDKLPFVNETLSEIHAIHVLEHLYAEQLFHCMDEIFRIIKPTGKFHIEVPIYGTQAWLINPDHKMHWNKDMIGFFMPPANGKDPHGFMKGYWHVDFLEHDNSETLEFDLYPNKLGIKKYPYKAVDKY